MFKRSEISQKPAWIQEGRTNPVRFRRVFCQSFAFLKYLQYLQHYYDYDDDDDDDDDYGGDDDDDFFINFSIINLFVYFWSFETAIEMAVSRKQALKCVTF